MEKAQELEDMYDYSAGLKILEDMALECDSYKDDDVLKDLKENIIKRKGYMANTSRGIYNNCNTKAYNMSISQAYTQQVCKSGFTKNLYKTRTQLIMSDKLESRKSCL